MRVCLFFFLFFLGYERRRDSGVRREGLDQAVPRADRLAVLLVRVQPRRRGAHHDGNLASCRAGPAVGNAGDFWPRLCCCCGCCLLLCVLVFAALFYLVFLVVVVVLLFQLFRSGVHDIRAVSPDLSCVGTQLR